MHIQKRLTTLLLSVATLPLMAQQAIPLRQFKLDQNKIPPANYSGICRVDSNVYAVVSDKEKDDGFYLMSIDIDTKTGKVRNAQRMGFYGSPANKKDRNGMSTRDIEGITYRPSSKTFFLGGEGDQQVLEYDAMGYPTGLKLDMPPEMGIKEIRSNLGIESLTYNPNTQLFWTTTESTLKKDGLATDKNNPENKNRLRIQCFHDNLKCGPQYAYMMESPICGTKGRKSKALHHGVSELCALDDGCIVVMERETYVSKKNLNNYVNIRLFVINPTNEQPINKDIPLSQLPQTAFMQKTEICAFKTKTNLTRRNIANYEGMCLGPKLDDGRQTLILINDTQNGMTKFGIRLKEYIKVIILPQ